MLPKYEVTSLDMIENSSVPRGGRHFVVLLFWTLDIKDKNLLNACQVTALLNPYI